MPSPAAGLVVVKPGPLATVQDLGRPGWGRFGISPSGAMDPLAARAANLLAGNGPGAPLLELTGAGAALRFEAARLIAVAGADLGAEISDGAKPVLPFSAVPVDAGAVLRFTARRRGARAYVAVAGGLVAPRVFDSAAVDLGGGLGGVPLRAGDGLAFGDLPAARPAAPGAAERETVARALVAWYDDPDRLRFVPAADVPPAALQAFADASWLVTPRSNRAGYRLDGPPLPLGARPDMVSEPIAPGTIQVPPDGRPILLMADRQTVGGYPVLGWLARADAPKAAQLWPGDHARFVAVPLDEAQRALRAQEAALAAALSP